MAAVPDVGRARSPESLAWALTVAEQAFAGAELPAGGRTADSPASFDDRRRADSLLGVAPYEVGDDPGAVRWREFVIRDELLVNVYETRAAEPTVLLLTVPTPCLVNHRRLHAFATWWMLGLGRWALAVNATVHVNDDDPAFACRGPGQVERLAERAAHSTTPDYDALDRQPNWTATFAIASAVAATAVVAELAARLSGRWGRLYALVAAEDLHLMSRRARRPDGGAVRLTAPAGEIARSAVDEAIEAGERNGIGVVPIVVGEAVADYRTAVRRLAEGGPP